jgi:hypothetical protein
MSLYLRKPFFRATHFKSVFTEMPSFLPWRRKNKAEDDTSNKTDARIIGRRSTLQNQQEDSRKEELVDEYVPQYELEWPALAFTPLAARKIS